MATEKLDDVAGVVHSLLLTLTKHFQNGHAIYLRSIETSVCVTHNTLVSLQSFFSLYIYYFENTVHKEVSLSKNKPLPFKSVFSVHDFLIKLVSSNHSLI